MDRVIKLANEEGYHMSKINYDTTDIEKYAEKATQVLEKNPNLILYTLNKNTLQYYYKWAQMDSHDWCVCFCNKNDALMVFAIAFSSGNSDITSIFKNLKRINENAACVSCFKESDGEYTRCIWCNEGVLCEDCVVGWMELNQSCPTCRRNWCVRARV